MLLTALYVTCFVQILLYICNKLEINNNRYKERSIIRLINNLSWLYSISSIIFPTKTGEAIVQRLLIRENKHININKNLNLRIYLNNLFISNFIPFIFC